MKSVAKGWIPVGLALFSLGIVAVLLIGGTHVTLDDGFYYFKIAQNIASGAGSTFDGLHATNGYHPLWLLMLVPVFWLTPDPSAALTVGIVIQAILWACGVVLVYYIARLSLGCAASTMAALLWIMFTYRTAMQGLEFSLQALCVLATAYVYLRWFTPNTPNISKFVGLSLLLSLTFLARVDTIALAGVIGASLVGRELRVGPTRDGAKRLLAFIAPLLLTIAAYAAYNVWLFGHAQPVSSAVKQLWSEALLHQDPLFRTHGWFAAKIGGLLALFSPLQTQYPIVIGTLAVLTWWLLRVPGLASAHWYEVVHHSPFDRFAVNPIAAFGVLQVLGVVVIYHHLSSFTRWYFVVQPWLTALFLSSIFEQLLRWRRSTMWTESASPHLRRLRHLVTLSLVIVWCGVPLYTLRVIVIWQYRERAGDIRHPLGEAAQWARTNLPADAVIGTWNAGEMGYRSGRRVVNLDGLVNTWDYFLGERLDLCRYWRKAGVTYLIDIFENGVVSSYIPYYPSYAHCADQLELVWTDDSYGQNWQVQVYRLKAASRSSLRSHAR